VGTALGDWLNSIIFNQPKATDVPQEGENEGVSEGGAWCPIPGAGTKGEEKPNLLTPEDAKHVLDSDENGGGHRSGQGKPGKTEFPPGWSDEKILGEISDVATDPGSKVKPGRGGMQVIEGKRDGVDIRTIYDPNTGRMVGWPTKGPGVIQNPR
jgi:hypothetical protein